MKITQDETVESQTVLHIELEDPDLAPYLDRGYRRMVQRIAIPGFRKGKAPRRVVETFIGRESLLNEVLDTMVSEVTDLAIKEQEIEAAGLPQIEMLDLEPFTLKATVPLRPEVALGNYLDIRIAFEPEEANDEDIDRRIEEIQQSLATWEPVERPIEFGDLVTLKIIGKVGDTTIVDDEDGTFFLDEDGARPLPGFGQELTGKEANQSIQFTLSIPDDYQDPSVAGQEASFDVNVKEIKERNLPALDDEFAKGLPEAYESMEVLRTSVENALKEEADNRASRHYEDLVTQALLDGSTLDISPVMVEHELSHIEETQNNFLQQLNIRRDDYLRSLGKTSEEQREEARGEAEQRISRTFALNKMSDLEGIEVEDAEIDEKLVEMEQSAAQDPDATPDADTQRDSVERMLKYEKTVARLVEIAKAEPVAAQSEHEPDTDETTPEGEDETDASEA